LDQAAGDAQEMNGTEKDRRRHTAGKAEPDATPALSAGASPAPRTQTAQQALDLAAEHHNAGRLPEAESLYRQVLRDDPDQPVALHLLGLIAHQRGDNDGAVELIIKSLALKPDYASAQNNLGQVRQAQGLVDEAIASFEKALAIEPDMADAHNNLGVAYYGIGRLDDAERCFRRVLELAPDYVNAHNNFGSLLLEKGNLAEAETCFRRAIELSPDFAIAIENLGVALLKQGKPADALEYCRRCLELDPDNINARVSLAGSLDSLVPPWHSPMMNDRLRNDAYLAALQAAVTADTHVLEIGTGSGLLAMMAARCGAGKVTTCEISPTIAATAEDIIAANGMAAAIDVIAKESTDIEVGLDLPRPADLLVSEIFSNELLGEWVLPSIEDAKRRLLGPGGRIIPSKGTIMIALFGGDHIGKNIRVDDVCGFDLGKFNLITSKKRSLRAQDYDIELLSDGVEAFDFHFEEDDYFPSAQKTLRIPAATAGTCHGIIQWLRMQMDDTLVIENHPSIETPASAWQHAVYIFDNPVQVKPNQTAVISAMHNRIAPWFALAGLEEG
jgi:Tfp pilus assembly protein PilF